MTAKKPLNFSGQSRQVLVNDLSATAVANRLRDRRRASDNGGNSVAQATSLGVLRAAPKIVRGNVSASDPDFFTITIDATRDVSLRFENRSRRNIVGSVVDAQGNIVNLGTRRLTGVARPGRSGTLSASGIPPGTYTFRLTSTGRQPNEYRLRLSAPLPFDCGCSP